MRFDEVFRVAASEGVAVEINSHPRRLELDWREIPAAKALGVKFAIDPDAHHVSGYQDLRYGIGAARKGWLGPGDVINTLPVEDALRFFGARR